MSTQLLIVVPVYNEREHLPVLFSEWQTVLEQTCADYRWVFINDGSTDGTDTWLNELEREHAHCVTVLRQSNSGHGSACRRGYEWAVQQASPWILQIDSDGQCDPDYFNDMWRVANEKNLNVFAQRTVRGDGVARAIISVCASVIASLFLVRNVGDVNVPYRLMKTQDVRSALDRIPKQFDLQNMGLTVALLWLKKERVLHPIYFRQRQGGVNSINFGNVLRMGVRFLMQLPSLWISLRKGQQT